MNWAQFKDAVSHMCLIGIVATSWSLTQEVAGLSPFNDKHFLSLNSANSVKTFRKNSNALRYSFTLSVYNSVHCIDLIIVCIHPFAMHCISLAV